VISGFRNIYRRSGIFDRSQDQETIPCKRFGSWANGPEGGIALRSLDPEACISSCFVLTGAPEKISTALAWLIGRATASASEAKVADKAKESY
jgi:hypothetical protein